MWKLPGACYGTQRNPELECSGGEARGHSQMMHYCIQKELDTAQRKGTRGSWDTAFGKLNFLTWHNVLKMCRLWWAAAKTVKCFHLKHTECRQMLGKRRCSVRMRPGWRFVYLRLLELGWWSKFTPKWTSAIWSHKNFDLLYYLFNTDYFNPMLWNERNYYGKCLKWHVMTIVSN